LEMIGKCDPVVRERGRRYRDRTMRGEKKI
jgi:hypothetical protein